MKSFEREDYRRRIAHRMQMKVYTLKNLVQSTKFKKDEIIKLFDEILFLDTFIDEEDYNKMSTDDASVIIRDCRDYLGEILEREERIGELVGESIMFSAYAYLCMDSNIEYRKILVKHCHGE